MLYLIRTNLGDGPLENDYAVLNEQRQQIGRIYFARETAPGFPPWYWGDYRGRAKGWAWNLEEAKIAFKEVWESP